MMRNHRVGPPGHGIVSVPIREHSIARPHRSDVLATVGVVQEHATIIAIRVDAVVVAGIVGVGNVDGGVNDPRLY